MSSLDRFDSVLFLFGMRSICIQSLMRSYVHLSCHFNNVDDRRITVLGDSEWELDESVTESVAP